MREGPDDAGQRSGPGDDVTPGRWQQRAGFSVFFDLQPGGPGPLHRRTRVYHEETGDETTFPDGEPADWVQWMLGRLESAQPEPAAAGGGETVMTIEIIDARLIGDTMAVGTTVGIELQLRVTGLAELYRALGATVAAALFGPRPQ